MPSVETVPALSVSDAEHQAVGEAQLPAELLAR